MKKLIILTLLFVLGSSWALALDECKAVMNQRDTPCFVFLPVNTTETSCNTINVSFFKNDTLVESQFMDQINSFMCSGNFTQNDVATYTISYSTGDSGSILLEFDEDNQFFLYIVALIFFLGLLALGFFIEDEIPITMAGMLSIIIAINIFINGFPNLENEFLKNAMVTVLAGIGMFFIVAPNVELIEQWRTSLSRFD